MSGKNAMFTNEKIKRIKFEKVSQKGPKKCLPSPKKMREYGKKLQGETEIKTCGIRNECLQN